jgi:hypothetical protein
LLELSVDQRDGRYYSLSIESNMFSSRGEIG